jgi:hypothetical protein
MTSTLTSMIAFFFALSPPAQETRQVVTTIVAKIQRADYEGDRAALTRLRAELTPFVVDRELGSRVLYWRGFALWRRALNGFNDGANPKELEEDLTQCVHDFREALARDPAFVDAKVGAGSCLVNNSFLNLKTNRTRASELFADSMAILNEAFAAAPDNPRLLWVRGANQWFAPPERGGGQDVALATYERGLDLARRQKGRGTDPLAPTWGEAELLTNLAFANLNRATPDLAAAESSAESALALVPYWHYVRDILLPQIRKAKGHRKFVAYDLNYVDQSHFIKDIKTFSGYTPTDLVQTVQAGIDLPCALILARTPGSLPTAATFSVEPGERSSRHCLPRGPHVPRISATFPSSPQSRAVPIRRRRTPPAQTEW